jgi:hypothetical protein
MNMAAEKENAQQAAQTTHPQQAEFSPNDQGNGNSDAQAMHLHRL